jgi:hypothetical protein
MFVMTIHEPATLLTDYALAALASLLAWRLRQRISPENHAARWFMRALVLTAISAFVGGSHHGFARNFAPPIPTISWAFTLGMIVLVSAAMALSLAHELAPPSTRNAWRAAIILKAAAFGALVCVRPEFRVVIADYGLTLLTWAAAAVLTRRPWRATILVGIALSVVAALVQQLRLSPSPRFNHNDLYHVIQAGALVALYRGALRLGAAPPPRRTATA